ncbi:F-box-like protein [Ceratobasidium sp. AG-Ba]|nr:F-box-like protein [Ceratobasidium sp. AG-Ba]
MSIRRALERSLTFPARKPTRHEHDYIPEDDSPSTPEPQPILVQPSLRPKQSRTASTHEHEQLIALRAEIAQCDAEEAELRHALAHVRARKQQALTHLHTLFRKPANLLSLSTFILSSIFQYLDAPTLESGVMLVCKRWRRTALSCPELWNTIQLHRGPVCARAYIKRARTVPLQVELFLPEPANGERVDWAWSNLKRPGDAEMLRERELERLLSPVLPLVQTWSSLCVQTPDVFSMQRVLGFCARAGGTRALRQLELGVTRLTGIESSASDFDQLEGFLSSECESLKRVQLTNMAWQWSPYALGCVSDLTIRLVNPDEGSRVYDLPSYFGTLVGAASLRSLSIKVEGNAVISTPGSDDDTSGASSPPAIVLPFLTHLSVHGAIPPTLLRLFNTPALRRLDLTLPRRAPTPLLPRGHQIVDLRLDGPNVPHIRLFQCLPDLVRLELGKDMPGRILDTLARHSRSASEEDPERTPIAPSQVQPFDEALCPLLDTLTLRGCERIKRESIEGLVDRRGGSLRKVRMFGMEGIGLKGEIRRTGTWMPKTPSVRKTGTSDVLLRTPKRANLSRRDTDAGFVVVSRDVRRTGMVTG